MYNPKSNITETNYKIINEKLSENKLKPGKYYRVVNQTTNEYTDGKLVWLGETQAELQVGSEFIVRSFHNNKFNKL